MRHGGHLGQILCQSHQRYPSVVAEAFRRMQLFSLEGTDEATSNLAELAKGAKKPDSRSRCQRGMNLPMAA